MQVIEKENTILALLRRHIISHLDCLDSGVVAAVCRDIWFLSSQSTVGQAGHEPSPYQTAPVLGSGSLFRRRLRPSLDSLGKSAAVH